VNTSRCQLGILVVSVALSWSGVFASTAAAGKSPRLLYKEVLRATVLVQVPISRQQTSSGTGWVVDRTRRLLITNFHVVAVKGKAARNVRVVFPAYLKGRVVAEKAFYNKKGRAVPARVVVSDPGRDLAVLQVGRLPPGVTALRLAPASPEPGETCHSVGNPSVSMAMWVYTLGTVRQVAQQRVKYPTGQLVRAVMVETQSPINPGDSGSPLVNGTGQLIGVNAHLDKNARLVSRAIAVTEVRKVLAVAQRSLKRRSTALRK
jgi:serine protease Do